MIFRVMLRIYYSETLQVFLCMDHLQLSFGDLSWFQNVFLSFYHPSLCIRTIHVLQAIKQTAIKMYRRTNKPPTDITSTWFVWLYICERAVRTRVVGDRPRTLEMVEYLAPLGTVEGMESL